jgi:hypothetical protein
MADEAIIAATFSDYKVVKGRQVLQLVFEVPLEAQEAIFRALGYVNPKAETWVGIARLRDGVATPEAVRQLRLPPKNSQMAGILCNEGGFRKYLAERSGKAVPDADAAAAVVRFACSVKSRADLDTDEHGAKLWRDLKAEYEVWKMDVAA